MLSRTAQLAADRAVRSIARTYQDAPSRYTPAQFAREHADRECMIRGYRFAAFAVEWTEAVERDARAAIEDRIQSTAPNAVNAAPLMPICDSCGGTGTIPDALCGQDTCYTCDGTGGLRATREGFPAIIHPGHLGADESLPAYAWPGGYPLIYLDRDNCVCCADCATNDLHLAADDPDDGYTRFTSAIEDGDLESDTICDGCNAIIAHQNYCYECGESVDTEDTPHLCPKTEPYDVWYLLEAPGDHWKRSERRPSGPEEAAAIAGELRAMPGVAAFVHVQPSRLSFPPVVSEEEE